MELVQISSHIHAVLQLEGGLGASNSGFVDLDGGLVIDSFWDLPRTRKLIDLYASVDPTPARRLLNTHNNGDHCWGNQLFAELGTELLGHRLCAENFALENPELMQALADTADDVPPAFAVLANGLRRFDFHGITLTPPTHLLDGDTTLELGTTTVELLYVGPAHTAGDMVAFLPDDGVVFTGDILFNQCTPIGWEGTFDGWIAALDRVAALEPSVVVPGHGPVCGVEELREMQAYLGYVRDEARSHYDAGHSTLDAAKSIELGRFAAWEEPERLAFQIDRAYREFDGQPWDTRVDIAKVFGEVAALRDVFSS